jgi:hypothetical protein
VRVRLIGGLFGENARESAARRWGKSKHATAWCACQAKHTILDKSYVAVYSHQGLLPDLGVAVRLTKSRHWCQLHCVSNYCTPYACSPLLPAGQAVRNARGCSTLGTPGFCPSCSNAPQPARQHTTMCFRFCKGHKQTQFQPTSFVVLPAGAVLSLCTASGPGQAPRRLRRSFYNIPGSSRAGAPSPLHHRVRLAPHAGQACRADTSTQEASRRHLVVSYKPIHFVQADGSQLRAWCRVGPSQLGNSSAAVPAHSARSMGPAAAGCLWLLTACTAGM